MSSPTPPHVELIETFYRGFQARDADQMARCYHPEVRFQDPVFPNLCGPRASAMWRMLCERGQDLVLSYDSVEANDKAGSAKWEARYTFSGSGRAVHNRITARFTFRDGLILTHRDDFDLWRWSRQALGVRGWLLGWSPLLRSAVQQQADRSLQVFEARRDRKS